MFPGSSNVLYLQHISKEKLEFTSWILGIFIFLWGIAPSWQHVGYQLYIILAYPNCIMSW